MDHLLVQEPGPSIARYDEILRNVDSIIPNCKFNRQAIGRKDKQLSLWKR